MLRDKFVPRDPIEARQKELLDNEAAFPKTFYVSGRGDVDILHAFRIATIRNSFRDHLIETNSAGARTEIVLKKLDLLERLENQRTTLARGTTTSRPAPAASTGSATQLTLHSFAS